MKSKSIKLVLILILLMSILDYFFGKYSENFGNPAPDIVRVFLIFISIRFIINSKELNYFFKNNFNKTYFIIIIYLFIACLFSPLGLKVGSINFIRILYPFLLMMFFYLLSFGGYITKKNILFLYKNLIIILFIMIFSFLSYKAGIGRLAIGDNKGYTILFCTPIVFLLTPKKSYIFYYSLIIIGTLIAAKRGAFIGLSLTFLIFIYCLKHYPLKSKMLIFLVLPFFVAIGYNYFADNIYIFERFNNLSEDGGSGRDVMYTSIWQGWQKANLFNQIFGSGWMSQMKHVKSDLFMHKGLMAHNDWLQFIYDLGLVGITLLASMFYALLKQIHKYKKKSNLYFALLCAFSIFIFRSISGGTFGDTGAIPYLLIGLGYILGKVDREKYGLPNNN